MYNNYRTSGLLPSMGRGRGTGYRSSYAPGASASPQPRYGGLPGGRGGGALDTDDFFHHTGSTFRTAAETGPASAPAPPPKVLVVGTSTAALRAWPVLFTAGFDITGVVSTPLPPEEGDDADGNGSATQRQQARDQMARRKAEAFIKGCLERYNVPAAPPPPPPPSNTAAPPLLSAPTATATAAASEGTSQASKDPLRGIAAVASPSALVRPPAPTTTTTTTTTPATSSLPLTAGPLVPPVVVKPTASDLIDGKQEDTATSTATEGFEPLFRAADILYIATGDDFWFVSPAPNSAKDSTTAKVNPSAGPTTRGVAGYSYGMHSGGLGGYAGAYRSPPATLSPRGGSGSAVIGGGASPEQRASAEVSALTEPTTSLRNRDGFLQYCAEHGKHLVFAEGVDAVSVEALVATMEGCLTTSPSTAAGSVSSASSSAGISPLPSHHLSFAMHTGNAHPQRTSAAVAETPTGSQQLPKVLLTDTFPAAAAAAGPPTDRIKALVRAMGLPPMQPLATDSAEQEDTASSAQGSATVTPQSTSPAATLPLHLGHSLTPPRGTSGSAFTVSRTGSLALGPPGGVLPPPSTLAPAPTTTTAATAAAGTSESGRTETQQQQQQRARRLPRGAIGRVKRLDLALTAPFASRSAGDDKDADAAADESALSACTLDEALVDPVAVDAGAAMRALLRKALAFVVTVMGQRTPAAIQCRPLSWASLETQTGEQATRKAKPSGSQKADADDDVYVYPSSDDEQNDGDGAKKEQPLGDAARKKSAQAKCPTVTPTSLEVELFFEVEYPAPRPPKPPADAVASAKPAAEAATLSTSLPSPATAPATSAPTPAPQAPTLSVAAPLIPPPSLPIPPVLGASAPTQGQHQQQLLHIPPPQPSQAQEGPKPDEQSSEHAKTDDKAETADEGTTVSECIPVKLYLSIEADAPFMIQELIVSGTEGTIEMHDGILDCCATEEALSRVAVPAAEDGASHQSSSASSTSVVAEASPTKDISATSTSKCVVVTYVNAVSSTGARLRVRQEKTLFNAATLAATKPAEVTTAAPSTVAVKAGDTEKEAAHRKAAEEAVATARKRFVDTDESARNALSFWSTLLTQLRHAPTAAGLGAASATSPYRTTSPYNARYGRGGMGGRYRTAAMAASEERELLEQTKTTLAADQRFCVKDPQAALASMRQRLNLQLIQDTIMQAATAAAGPTVL